MNDFMIKPKIFSYQEYLSSIQLKRYSRHLLLPGFDEKSQLKLLNSQVAVVGAGGLGSAILQYLAAAGIGKITVIDHDLVEISNLQRQTIHFEKNLGTPKAVSAAEKITALNSQVQVQIVDEALTAENALEILEGHDLVLDGTDNFPTRYLVSDACEILNLPLVWGSILGFDGQVSVFFADASRGATYRDLHPAPPKPGEVPNCAQAGVLGMLVGIIGSAMALEAVKVLTGIGQPLFKKVAFFDALSHSWEEIPYARIPGRKAVTQLEDLVLTCGFEPVQRAENQGAENWAGESQGIENQAVENVAENQVASLRELTPAAAAQAVKAGATLIDIREVHEVAAGMLPGAIHIPQQELLAKIKANPNFIQEFATEVIVHCQGGSRSARLQAELAQQGIMVTNLLGGYSLAQAAFRK